VKWGYAHILERMRPKRITPQHGRRVRWPSAGARVQKHVALGVPANERAPTANEVDCRPLVGMDWSALSRPNKRIQDTHSVILQH